MSLKLADLDIANVAWGSELGKSALRASAEILVEESDEWSAKLTITEAPEGRFCLPKGQEKSIYTPWNL